MDIQKKYFSQNDSWGLKGIAILCVIFYYLFHTVSKLEAIDAGTLFFSYNRVAQLSTLCHMGVSLFVFITGYGLAQKVKQYQGVEYYKTYFRKKYIQFAGKLTVAVMTSVIVCGILMQQKRFKTSYGSGFLAKTCVAFLNATGLAEFARVEWFVDSWWYAGIFILLLVVAPIVYWLCRKITPYALFVISIVALLILSPMGDSKSIVWYLPIFILGMVCEDYRIFEIIESKLLNTPIKRIVVTVVLICLCIVTAYTRKYFTNKALFNVIFSLECILLLYTCILKIKGIKSVFSFIGKYSLWMWLFFVQIYKWWFSKYITQLQNIWLVYLVVVVAALLLSLLICGLRNIYIKLEREKINIFWKRDWVLAIGLVVINYFVIFCKAIPAYLTNDECIICRVLSGTYLGTPFPIQQYLNVLVTYPISKMYTFFPEIPWWFLWTEFLIVIGMFGISYATIHFARKSGYSTGFAISVAEIFQGTLIFYNVWRPSFTASPAILGCALIALVYKFDEIKDEPGKKKYLIVCLGILGILIACCHRQQTGMVVSVYVGLAFFYCLMKSRYSLKKKFFLFGIGTLILVAIPTGVKKWNSYINLQVNGVAHTQFNGVRSAYKDYPHDSYEDNPELYQSVGWTEETYYLAEKWCFLQDEVTTDNLTYLVKNSTVSGKDIAGKLWKALWKSDETKPIIIGAVVSFIVMGFYFCFHHNRIAFLTYIFNLLGSVFLLGYLTIKGRLIYRAVLVVLILAVFTNILLLVLNNRENASQERYTRFALLVTVFVLLFPIVDTAFITKKTHKYVQEKAEQEHAVYDYLEQHQDNIYVTEIHITADIDPFNLQSEKNMIYYGGAQYLSGVMQRKLEKLGIEKLDGSIFEKENVYFLSKIDIDQESTLTELNTLSAFYHQLQKNYGVVGIEKVDTITEGTYVYQFQFAEYK